MIPIGSKEFGMVMRNCDSKEWKDACKRDNEEEQRVFGSGGAAMFFYYFLDTKDLTDHGGSVPGWLNEKGDALLDELTEFLENEE